MNGRVFQPSLTASSRKLGTQIELLSPAVGLWRHRPLPGTLIVPGADLGELEILGVLHRVVAPAGAVGLVLEDESTSVGALPVAYATTLCSLDPGARPDVGAPDAGDLSAATAGGLVFRSPLSGRFYARPAPDKPPFCKAGDAIKIGQTVALLEVMKTFNRIAYAGDGLPDSARIKRVVPNDQDDVEAGDPLLELEKF